MAEEPLKNTIYGGTPYNRRRGFPAVINYSYSSNSSIRSNLDNTFRWEEVFLEEEAEVGIGFRMPHGYVIQVSPDLGLKNVMDHFIPDTADGEGNTLLRTSSQLTFDNGSLVSNDDGSVTATIPSDILKRLLHDSPRQKYYWRAVAIDESDAWGNLGIPVSFHYRKIVLNDEWSIDPVVTPSKEPIQTIGGTKTSDISLIEINGETEGVSYPTVNSWRYDAVLVGGDNEFLIRAKDVRGNWSDYKIVEITLGENSTIRQDIWNTFDEFGLIMGIERISGESNKNFMKRILDVSRNTAGLQYIGVLLGAVRELDARFDSSAIILKPYKTSRNLGSPSIIIDTTGLIITSEYFQVKKEPAIVDPCSLSVFLKKNIRDQSSLHIENQYGKTISDKEYNIDFVNNAIKFNSDKYTKQVVYVSYSYEEILDYFSYTTVADIVKQLNLMMFPMGGRIFRADIGHEMSGSESSEGLVLTPPLSFSQNSILKLGWSEIKIREVSDIGWRNSFRNDRGNFFGTRWMRYIEQLRSLAKSEWGQAVADVATWDAGVVGEGPQAVIPRQFDSSLGRWLISGSDKVVDPSAARFFGYVDADSGSQIVWSGVSRVKSGIGCGEDLLVRLDTFRKVETRTLRDIKIVASNNPPQNIAIPSIRVEI